jgi:hypothetical protein
MKGELVFDSTLPREPDGGAGQYGRSLPDWLAPHFADSVACALDPDCDAQQCEEGVDGHPRVREVNAVIGEDKHYLCDRHMAEALGTGRIRPEVCVRCGRDEGVNMGHLLVASAKIIVWFRVCDRCRPGAERELGVPA